MNALFCFAEHTALLHLLNCLYLEQQFFLPLFFWLSPPSCWGGSDWVTGWGPGSTHHKNTEEGDKTEALRWHFSISWWKEENPKAGKSRWQLTLKAGPVLWLASKVTSTTFFYGSIATETRLAFFYETGFRNFVIFHFRSPRNISIFL